MIGNLTRDPEYKQLPSGQPLCRLGLASNRQFKNKQSGSMVQEVCYVDIDVWGPQAESCRQYLQKGRAVLVEGRLKFDTWEDPQGQNRSKHTIVADRVVFMPASATAEFSAAERTETPKNSQEEELEKELLEQIEQIKQRAQEQKSEAQDAVPKKVAKPAKPKETAVPEQSAQSDGEGIEFKDQPPFEDELPF